MPSLTRKRWVLMNPGPVNVTARVRQALLGPDLCHRERILARPTFSKEAAAASNAELLTVDLALLPLDTLPDVVFPALHADEREREHGEVIRIISARKATKRESTFYQGAYP